MQDFNDDAFSPELDTRMPPVSNFSMYPPAESTPRVIIEPLPDISKLRAAQSQHLNQQRLRPRIGACLERSRSESDDDIDSVKKDYNIDKTQLHTLLSKCLGVTLSFMKNFTSKSHSLVKPNLDSIAWYSIVVIYI